MKKPIKKISIILVVVILGFCIWIFFLDGNPDVLWNPESRSIGNDAFHQTKIPARFMPLPLNQVRPEGWMKAQLQRDLESGFTGHLDELTHWARADIFSEERIVGYRLTGNDEREHIPKSWWPGETNPVWMDGYLQSAFLSGDPTAIEKSNAYIRNILGSRTDKGYIGIYLPEARYNHSTENAELWAQSRVFRVLLDYYEITGEEEVLRALEKTVDLTMHHYDGSDTYFGVDNGLGGVSHGLMFMDVLEWLYRLTGNNDYVEYGVQLYRDYSLFENPRLNDSRLDYLLDPDRPIVGHTPHAAEHLRVPAWLFHATADSTYLKAYELGYRKLKQYMVPSGAVHSGEKEDVEGLLPEPHMPYEYCGITELFDTQTSLLRKTGKTSFADEAELLFLNAGQGARLSDGKGVNYFSRDNKFKATPEGSGGRFKFSPTHEDVAVCCNPNAAKLMPYYIRNMYMQTGSDLPVLACMLFGPSEVRTRISGTSVRLEQLTRFPFSDSLTFHVDPDKKVAFELWIRIPQWAADMEVSAGKAKLSKEEGFYVLKKKWKKGDQVKIVFKPAIEEIKTVNGEVALKRGPLLYALPLPHHCEEIKSYPLEGFADLSCVPADSSFWDLEMPAGENAPDFTFRPGPSINQLYPWDDSPLKLTGTLLNRAGEEVPVELLPIGATVLRRVSFPAHRPNVVLILADDLGYGGTGYNGDRKLLTPHIDQLAEEGIIFTDAHSPSAVCSPTRYGILTGEYAWRSWLRNWVLMEHMPLLLDTSRLSLPGLFKNAGYATGCVGKWHLGWGDSLYPNWEGKLSPGPIQCGFDYFYGVPYSHNSSQELQVFVENDSIVVRNRRLDRTATKLAEKATDFIRSNHEDPFFLYYPLTNIHLPHTPDSSFLGSSEVGVYGDFISEMDWAVGQVLSCLDSLGLSGNTLVIFTSDNGAKTDSLWSLNGHRPNGDLRGGKATIYEGGHRIPFVARWPGNIGEGTRCSRTICLTDLMATCSEILEVKLPAGTGPDSESILSFLTEGDASKIGHGPVVHHSVSGMFALRHGNWKYIEGRGNGYQPTDWKRTQESGRNKPLKDPDSGRFLPLTYYWPNPSSSSGPPAQLYNLEDDPGEQRNLYEIYPEKVKEMRALLEEIRYTNE